MQLYKKAFTLTELLMALAIVGALAALMVPNIMDQMNRNILANQTKNIVTSILDLANEKLAETPSKDLRDTDFASPATLLSSNNFVIVKTCTAVADGCWASSYQTLNKTAQNTSKPARAIVLKNGATLGYTPYAPNTGSFSAGNEELIGRFHLDVNGPDKPNILGRDYFMFRLTNKGRIIDGYSANMGFSNVTDAALKTWCYRGYTYVTTCLTLLERNNWKMNY